MEAIGESLEGAWQLMPTSTKEAWELLLSVEIAVQEGTQ
jgi:hypothetical protein